MNEYKDDTLKPNDTSVKINENAAKFQPVRPSSTSLYQMSVLNKKKARKVREVPARGDIEGSATYAFQDLTIEVRGQLLDYNETTSKVFNLALIKYKKTHDRVVHFTLREFMEKTGLSDRKNASLQLSKAIQALWKLAPSRNNFNSLTKKQQQYEPFSYGMYPFPKHYYRNGKGWLELDEDFAKALDTKTSNIICPPTLLKLKGTAYALYDAILTNKQINYNKSKARQQRMKFKSILEHCTNLPCWEDVKYREQRKRIINPIKKAIEVDLKDVISCSYIDANGNSQPSIDNLPTDDFQECYLVVEKWLELNTDQLEQVKGKKQKKSKK